ncbi:tetraacyldisaccharide 4'-kinase [Aquimarina macrocephali]|uniref:tetraacyldisaccharide 4'-kinase n=1 Tax=Aquimarina macrocephali TaxID=666563 RepID=UPI0004663C16|nr:tetraacyldisaccharide 4'-kinase [Aquimarina macrocephali]
MNLLRKILLPFVPFYFLATWLRNKLYDLGIKKSTTYDFPLIVVGNLSVGGTGKSPMIEYLVTLLKDKIPLATLSRGYKRETKGFKLVDTSFTAKQVGDEPLQFKRKFTDVVVAVDADRCSGISNLRSLTPKPEVILLDDAYQHRKVKAGFYILLTAYYDLYCNDIVLPTGNLREPKKGADRADIIVVTKCPNPLSFEERKRITDKLAINSNQDLFFTTIDYGNNIVNISETKPINSLQNIHFTLVTGIANPTPLLDHYTSLGLKFDHINFPDHHNFTDTELKKLNTLEFIITTEKDYVRLAPDISEKKLWYQPIEVRFIEGATSFDDKILKFIEKK